MAKLSKKWIVTAIALAVVVGIGVVSWLSFQYFYGDTKTGAVTDYRPPREPMRTVFFYDNIIWYSCADQLIGVNEKGNPVKTIPLPDSRDAVALEGDYLILSREGALRAASPADGKTLWTADFEPTDHGMSGDFLYVGDNLSKIHVIDLKKGQQVNVYNVDSVNHNFQAAGDGSVLREAVFNHTESDSELERQESTERTMIARISPTEIIHTPQMGLAYPSVLGDKVLAPDEMSAVSCLDLATLKPRWKSDEYFLQVPETYKGGGTIFARTGANDRERVGGEIDLSNGKWKWKSPLGYGDEVAVFDNGEVAVAINQDAGADTSSAKVRLLSTATKKTIWESAKLNGAVYIMEMFDGICLIGTDRALIALDAKTGKKVWENTPPGGPLSNHKLKNGIVYGTTGDSNPALYAVDVHTGKELWRKECTPARASN